LPDIDVASIMLQKLLNVSFQLTRSLHS